MFLKKRSWSELNQLTDWQSFRIEFTLVSQEKEMKEKVLTMIRTNYKLLLDTGKAKKWQKWRKKIINSINSVLFINGPSYAFKK